MCTPITDQEQLFRTKRNKHLSEQKKPLFSAVINSLLHPALK